MCAALPMYSACILGVRMPWSALPWSRSRKHPSARHPTVADHAAVRMYPIDSTKRNIDIVNFDSNCMCMSKHVCVIVLCCIDGACYGAATCVGCALRDVHCTTGRLPLNIVAFERSNCAPYVSENDGWLLAMHLNGLESCTCIVGGSLLLPLWIARRRCDHVLKTETQVLNPHTLLHVSTTS